MVVFRSSVGERSQTLCHKTAQCLVLPFALICAFEQKAFSQETSEICLYVNEDLNGAKYCTSQTGLQNLPDDFGTNVRAISFDLTYRVQLFANRDGENPCFTKDEDWYISQLDRRNYRREQTGQPPSNRITGLQVFEVCPDQVASFSYSAQRLRSNKLLRQNLKPNLKIQRPIPLQIPQNNMQ
jgi:hypothetical protein